MKSITQKVFERILNDDQTSELIDTITLVSLQDLLETCVSVSRSDPINDPVQLELDIEALRRVIAIYQP
jgi:hypothetical protein